MTLLDAIRSGRPFKRANERLYTIVHQLPNSKRRVLKQGKHFRCISREDVLATDWMIKSGTNDLAAQVASIATFKRHLDVGA